MKNHKYRIIFGKSIPRVEEGIVFYPIKKGKILEVTKEEVDKLIVHGETLYNYQTGGHGWSYSVPYTIDDIERIEKLEYIQIYPTN